MPGADQKFAPPVASKHRDFLANLAPPDPTLAEVLLAIQALDRKVDLVLAASAPQRSTLTIDPDEIARTMAQLKLARPVTQETPP